MTARTVALVLINLVGFIVAGTVMVVLAVQGGDPSLAALVLVAFFWALVCTFLSDWSGVR